MEPDARAKSLYKSALSLVRLARRADSRAGVGPAQLGALGVLDELGPLSVQQLAAIEGVAHATMSRTLTSLERTAYVRKKTDARDRRRLLIAITSKGRSAFLDAHKRREAMVSALVRSLQPATVVDLERVLSTLARQLKPQSDRQ